MIEYRDSLRKEHEALLSREDVRNARKEREDRDMLYRANAVRFAIAGSLFLVPGFIGVYASENARKKSKTK